MAILYIHINKINNKKYVGITKYSNPIMRWGENGTGYINSKFYDNGILQFGWENFEHILLNNDIDEDTAQQLESRLIKELDLTNEQYGYNESSGVKIRPNPNLDILCQNLIKNKININDFNINGEILQIEYRHVTNHYGINYLYTLYTEGKINTDLDCQRGYMWTEERQQGMWDTLLFGHRIPEFHAIREGLLYDIIDGKQRLTTIMEIINNNIACKKSYASEKLIPLFNQMNKTSFYFKDLPEYLQERILNTSCCVAEYSDVDGEDLIALFRKLNASMPLSDFSKGIADYILMRTDFTKYLIHHPTMQSIFTENDKAKSEDEKYLLRLAILIKKGINSNLVAREMARAYPEFTRKDLEKEKEIILNHLNIIQKHIGLLNGFRSIRSYLPIISFIIIEQKLNEEQIKSFFTTIRENNYSGRGDELNTTTIVNRYNMLMKLL